MADPDIVAMEGGCTCRGIRYRLPARPLFVHCCHCTWCQRETGSAFAINAMIEADNVEILAGAVKRIDLPSASGQGQQISRCPDCETTVWSNYAAAREKIQFIRVGTLDNPALRRRTFTSLPRPNSPGCCCLRARQRSQNFTDAPSCGRTTASNAIRLRPHPERSAARSTKLTPHRCS